MNLNKNKFTNTKTKFTDDPSMLSKNKVQSRKKLLPNSRAKKVQKYSENKTHSIVSIGLTVHDAPVDLREKLTIPENEWNKTIEELCCYPFIEEAAVLSTCNRIEIYIFATSWHQGVRDVEEWMSKTSGVTLGDLRPHLYLLRDLDAVMHLLRVSGGLDSLVMGEGQILAQVKQVYQVERNCPGFGRHLSGLFKQAIIAGKRVRTETGISIGGVSVSSASVELVQQKLPSHNLSDARIAIVGAGKMATLLVKHLISKGCHKITVLNRSLPRMISLADDFPECEFDLRLMSELKQVVANSDVLFAASSSEELLLLKNDVSIMPTCSEIVGGLRSFVDISVPRNIDPKINELKSHSIVYNVDDLKEVVATNKEERANSAAEAEDILHEELSAFKAWRDSLETVPTIKALRTKAESIRCPELERTLSKLGDGLSKKQIRAIEELSKSIVNKLLHGPMTGLRCDGTDPDDVERTMLNMEALERMFSLSELVKEEIESNAAKQE
jgi:glutamyl-tRNA reductase